MNPQILYQGLCKQWRVSQFNNGNGVQDQTVHIKMTGCRRVTKYKKNGKKRKNVVENVEIGPEMTANKILNAVKAVCRNQEGYTACHFSDGNVIDFPVIIDLMKFGIVDARLIFLGLEGRQIVTIEYIACDYLDEKESSSEKLLSEPVSTPLLV